MIENYNNITALNGSRALFVLDVYIIMTVFSSLACDLIAVFILCSLACDLIAVFILCSLACDLIAACV